MDGKNGFEVKKEKINDKGLLKTPSTFMLKLDADHARLSHVLKLKELFEKYRGNVPVQIEFLAQNRTIATLHIDSKWGVSPHAQLRQEINTIPSVR